MTAVQIPMDFAFRTAHGKENFLVAAPNKEAVAWIDRWPDWPGNFLLIIGPEGSGKTHLSQVWKQHANAKTLTVDDLREMDVEALTELADHSLLIEDLEDDIPEEALFHLYNLVKEKQGFLLMTSQSPVADWNLQLADLKSRMGAIQVTHIREVDDTLFSSILLKLFSDRQLQVSPEVVQYLITRLERSFSEARRMVTALDGLSLSEKRKITIPLVRDLLTQKG